MALPRCTTVLFSQSFRCTEESLDGYDSDKIIMICSEKSGVAEGALAWFGNRRGGAQQTAKRHMGLTVQNK